MLAVELLPVMGWAFGSKGMRNQLVWFRNDLRINDNPALFYASESGEPTIAVYVATPQQWQLHDDAHSKIDFWRRNLHCLYDSLAELISLCIFFRYRLINRSQI